ncbi:MAG: glycosyltransferase family 39 protein, partial [Anaerolineae bacterium]
MTRTTRSHKQRHPGEGILLVSLLVILLIGAGFRFYNINWDEGTYHIHPDERHTTMVITRIEWPGSLGEYFDTSRSLLNARNVDMVYFYGTLPLFLTKFVADVFGHTGYDEIHLVGRMLSALFDLGAVALLFFMARRLFDWRAGLISALLLALTALNIQGSHYFTVDTFLTFFVALTIWFTLDVAEGRSWTSFVGMGLMLACKVSVFLLLVVVALGGWVRLRRRARAGQSAGVAASTTLGGLVLAALLALIIFRVVQPYAWAGPNYEGWDRIPEPWGERVAFFQQVPEPIRATIMPNPQWVVDIVAAGAQQTGEADMPWGRQWTERPAWLWPLQNMVLWSLGVPLGVAAWLGVVLVTVWVVRTWAQRRRSPTEPPAASATDAVQGVVGPRGMANWDLVLIPLAWVVLTFLWQGMQYVKSVRYFMPIHPFLAMFAAFLVVVAWDWARGRRWVAKAAAGSLAAIVLLGTLAWAFAFVQIYTEPVTRVQATRWIYENVESGATLHYRSGDGQPGQLQLPLPSIQIYGADGQWQTTPFTPADDLVIREIVMNHLTGLEEPSEAEFEVRITDAGGVALASGTVESVFGGEGG